MIEKWHEEIKPALHDLCGHLMLICQGESPSKGQYKFKTSSETFGNSVISDVRKKKKKKQRGLTKMLFFCRGWT